MKTTTIGQLVVNEALPKDMQNYDRVLDKGGIKELLRELADKHPEKYRDVVHELYQIGAYSSQFERPSFSIRDLRPSDKVRKRLLALKAKVATLVERDDLTEEKRDSMVKDLVAKETDSLEAAVFEDGLAGKNPFATQVLSGSRGSQPDLRSLVAGDLLVTDHRDRVIPVPLLNSYSSGLDPAEYWAGSYGARKGTISTKFATQEAGFFGKQLVQASHRMVVTEADCGTERGIPADAGDSDSDGAILARSSGNFKSGTVIEPRMMRSLKGKTLIVRSPLTCQASKGICQRCVGYREKGKLPDIGENVGVAAATSLTEQLSQAQLSEKHKGGRASQATREDEISGFKRIEQMVNVPSTFRQAAALAQLDGTVDMINPAPQGGTDVSINGIKHWVPPGEEVKIKPGARVEAGDTLSGGIPNPADLVRLKGVGRARLDFVKSFGDAFKSSGLRANRRNVELLARSLINHVRIDDVDGVGEYLPDDIVEYDSLERNYTPRYGFKKQAPRASVGRFLEKPVLHYSIGTRITKSVADDLYKQGIKQVTSHVDDPPFSPEMVRAMENLRYSPDWQQRLGGSYLQKGLLESVHRGRKSEISGVSYIPALARSKDFGKDLKVTGEY